MKYKWFAILLTTSMFIPLATHNTIAAPTGSKQAEKAVQGWLKLNPNPMNDRLGANVENVSTYNDQQGQALYHIVSLSPQGFVIVPADTQIEPIIGFANDGCYDDSPDNPLAVLTNQDLRSRMEMIARQMQVKQAESIQTDRLDAQEKWKMLIEVADEPDEQIKAGQMETISDVRVAPLLASQWDQKEVCGMNCYNYYTPHNYFCGCVATALAQVMRYFEYPVTGVGTAEFKIRIRGLPRDASLRGGDGTGGPYNWSDMMNIPNCGMTDLQRQAIGALCYDAGVSVNMNYTPIGSGANRLGADALKGTFDYENAVVGKSYPTIDYGLNAMINPNLDAALPVLLGIFYSGHAIASDGYGYDTETLYHHLNLGWSGAEDAWYNLPDIPTTYCTFSCVRECVYNIYTNGTGEIISGRVTDAMGNPLENVTVKAFQSGSMQYQTITNAQGIYAFTKVPSYTLYTIEVSRAGYVFPSQTAATGKSVDYASTSGNRWGVDFVGTVPPKTIYVDIDALGMNNGTQWEDAFTDIQDALDAAVDGDEILVAAGTYLPTRQTNPPDTRSVTFQIISGTTMQGGYPGWQADDPGLRNVELYKTILSGDLANDDETDISVKDLSNDPNRSENCYHVISGSGTAISTMLDGFTITAGSSTDYQRGGGMFNDQAQLRISDCTFFANTAFGGGGIYNVDSSVTIIHCRFEKNLAVEIPGGGALYNQDSDVSIVDCEFVENAAAYSGGGIFNKGALSARAMTNCKFFDNTANYGGAIANNNCGSTITNSLFSGNIAVYSGGAIDNRGAVLINYINCTFHENSSQNSGGAIYARSGNVSRLVNSIIWGNIDPGNHQISLNNSDLYMIHCDYQGSETTVHTTGECTVHAWNTFNDDPDFVGHSLELKPTSPCVDAGDTSWLPPDSGDVDNDGDKAEPIPLDLYGKDRVVDGNGDGTDVVDIGACELSMLDEFLQIPAILSPDINRDGRVDLDDLTILALEWLQPLTIPLADITPPPYGDGIVDIMDFAELSKHWQ